MTARLARRARRRFERILWDEWLDVDRAVRTREGHDEQEVVPGDGRFAVAAFAQSGRVCDCIATDPPVVHQNIRILRRQD